MPGFLGNQYPQKSYLVRPELYQSVLCISDYITNNPEILSCQSMMKGWTITSEKHRIRSFRCICLGSSCIQTGKVSGSNRMPWGWIIVTSPRNELILEVLYLRTYKKLTTFSVNGTQVLPNLLVVSLYILKVFVVNKLIPENKTRSAWCKKWKFEFSLSVLRPSWWCPCSRSCCGLKFLSWPSMIVPQKSELKQSSQQKIRF